MREARRIVDGFNDTVADIAAWLDGSDDTDGNPEAAISVDEAEGRQLTIAQNLYDQYLSLVTSIMIRAPMLSEVWVDRYEHAILIPCHGVARESLLLWCRREMFFRAIGNLVVPALRTVRAIM